LDVVLHHHEKIDSTGYPDKLSGNDISLLSRMGAVCDVYDAITSNRPYKSGWDPALSIKRMSSWKGHFDPDLLKAFIKMLGIYPTGSLVKLSSDKLGVVIDQTPDSLLKPVIKVFFSTKPKGPITIEEIDLSAPRCEVRIVSIEDPAQWGFRHLDDLWMPF
jgi:HD-GYP domain-containing protein (c-di-GMP phosphodiesterase class II)